MAAERVFLIPVALVLTLSGCLCLPPPNAERPVDVRSEAKQLVQDIRKVVATAKDGQLIDLLHQDVLDLQSKVTDLLLGLPTEASECETNLVIKMAAAATGSHEVMTLLLAKDALSVLNGRLALSLAFLEHLAGQLEDDLRDLSTDLGPHLSAIAFGVDTTAGIIETADKTVKSMILPTHPNNLNNNSKDLHNRVRRQSINLGSGWSLGPGGVKWQSGSGMTTFTVAPTWSGIKPTGVKAGLIIRF